MTNDHILKDCIATATRSPRRGAVRELLPVRNNVSNAPSREIGHKMRIMAGPTIWSLKDDFLPVGDVHIDANIPFARYRQNETVWGIACASPTALLTR
jgi:hypothetical protein